jgi:hypothetical protein
MAAGRGALIASLQSVRGFWAGRRAPTLAVVRIGQLLSDTPPISSRGCADAAVACGCDAISEVDLSPLP